MKIAHDQTKICPNSVHSIQFSSVYSWEHKGKAHVAELRTSVCVVRARLIGYVHTLTRNYTASVTTGVYSTPFYSAIVRSLQY